MVAYATLAASRIKKGPGREESVMDEGLRERVAGIIADFDSQGIHRTGTEVDDDSAAWLAGRVGDLGVAPVVSRFAFQRVDVERAELELGEVAVEGVPVFDGGFTDANGVVARMGALGSECGIGVATSLPFDGSEQAVAIRRARREGMHAAILVVTDARMPPGGPAVFNAEEILEPYGPPVLQVGNEHWPAIEAAMHSGREVRLIACARRIPGSAANVGAVVAGRKPGLKPLVVMTPRSGWWQCASERGGGIAGWLEIMRTLRDEGPDRDVIFTANSGHELHHLGLDAFLAQERALVDGAKLWIHLGANFAARHSAIRLQYSDEAIRSRFASLADSPRPSVETPIGERPFGEARNVHDGGGQYLSILGDNRLFHHPADRWPDAVDLDSAVVWIRALSAAASAFAAD